MFVMKKECRAKWGIADTSACKAGFVHLKTGDAHVTSKYNADNILQKYGKWFAANNIKKNEEMKGISFKLLLWFFYDLWNKASKVQAYCSY